MIIAKNGTSYGEITDEIVKAHATYANSPFAKIDRDLNYQTIEEDEFSYDKLIDDFTVDELRAGFYEVAKYCTSETLKLYAEKHHSNDLEIQKYMKLNELKKLKEYKLSEFSYNDKVYQLDENSKVNINGKISQILLATSSGQDVQNINWITKDNKVVSFSKEEFMSFGVAVVTHTEAVLFKHDQLRTAVNNATSIDEIKAIEWVD